MPMAFDRRFLIIGGIAPATRSPSILTCGGIGGTSSSLAKFGPCAASMIVCISSPTVGDCAWIRQKHLRSEERRGGNECDSTFRFRWSTLHYKKNNVTMKYTHSNHRINIKAT